MNLTKTRLREIIQEELASISLAEEGEGGDQATDQPMEKDAEKLQTKLDTGPIETVFSQISNVKEFKDVMTLLLNKASQHPSIKKNNVRRVLTDLAREATAEAK
jgi:hypothetical protein